MLVSDVDRKEQWWARTESCTVQSGSSNTLHWYTVLTIAAQHANQPLCVGYKISNRYEAGMPSP